MSRNPRCICDEIFAEWEAEGIDYPTFLLEEEQRILYGHYASCHHQSPEPRGVLNASNVTESRPLSTMADFEARLGELLALRFNILNRYAKVDPALLRGNGAPPPPDFS